MAQRNETDGGTAFVAPLVLVDKDTEVLASVSFTGAFNVHGAQIARAEVLVDCSDTKVAEVTPIVTVPEGSVILGVVATVVEPFDGDTTTTFEVGVAGNADKYIDLVDFDASGIVGTTIFSATGANNDQKMLEYATVDIPVIATWTNTDNATEGSVLVQVIYC